jgi:hypothetical protein
VKQLAGAAIYVIASVVLAVGGLRGSRSSACLFDRDGRLPAAAAQPNINQIRQGLCRDRTQQFPRFRHNPTRFRPGDHV